MPSRYSARHRHFVMFDLSLLETPRWVLELSFVAYAVIVSGVVLLERRKPTSTLAWLLALILLPLVGLFAYVFFSRQRVRRRIRRRQRRPINPVEGTRNIANLEQAPQDISDLQRGLVRLALQTSAAPLRRANEVELLPTARDAYARMEESIENARRSIHVQFYIWHDDQSGRRLTALLTRRARAGIRVRVLYDHVGSFGLPQHHFAELRAAGGQVSVFGRSWFPYGFGRSRVNFRNHRKILIVDGTCGFVGGLNVGDPYLGPHSGTTWRDLLVRITGDAVVGLDATFLDDWLSTSGEVVDLQGNHAGASADTAVPQAPWRRASSASTHAAFNPFSPLPDRPMTSGGPLVQIIPSGPDIPVASAIAVQFSAAIAAAQRRSWITTPYLIPDEPLSLILRTAALRGVDVRIMVPNLRSNDQRLVALASRSYYDELLESGVRIFEYQPGMLHAKYLIVDDVAAIGSANMDIRSFHVNYEITAMFYDQAVTAQLAQVFEEDLRRTREVRASDRIALPLPQRFAEGIARVLSPLL